MFSVLSALANYLDGGQNRGDMKRIVTFLVLVALGNVCRGDIIDLQDNPGALPAGKPSTVQVGVAASVNGHVQNISVTLDPISLDTTLNLVTYYQLNPITLSWPGSTLRPAGPPSCLPIMLQSR